MKSLRELRRLVGIGLIWGVLWMALVMIAGTIIGVVDPDSIDPGEEPIVLAPMVGLAGFVCGVVFSALVAAVERAKPIVDLSYFRVVMWGTLVCAALPLVMGKAAPEMIVTAPLGALSAVLSVAIVRKWAALPLAR